VCGKSERKTNSFSLIIEGKEERHEENRMQIELSK
jgi:hypothetical protein